MKPLSKPKDNALPRLHSLLLIIDANKNLSIIYQQSSFQAETLHRFGFIVANLSLDDYSRSLPDGRDKHLQTIVALSPKIT